jgi:hypothetical protein
MAMPVRAATGSTYIRRGSMTQVDILGAGTPTPTPTRWGSAYAVYIGGEYLMFDCGPAATQKLVKDGELIFADELMSLRL